MKNMELMAPARNMECLKAALEAGADSIYFGFKAFNARTVAENFTEEEFKKGVSLIHSKQKKAYLTLNVLIKEQEIEDAIKYAVKAIEAGIDAIIVQDIGLGRILMKYNIPIIASTQLTTGNYVGVEVLNRLGFSRVVLARELNMSEISSIGEHVKNTELECFVHGGLCISYSGQCNASCVNENVAANRGICSTPCWDNYTLYRNGIKIRSGRLIKPKDMFGIEHLKELEEAGVLAFKIQGRTRSREYVTNVVSTYRKYIDRVNDKLDFHVELDDIERLKKSSPRGLMRGNLEKTINNDFVVTGEEKDIQIETVSNSWNYEKCQIPRNLTLKLNGIKHLELDKLGAFFSRIYIPYELFVPENEEKIIILSKKAPIYLVMPIIFERHLSIYDKVADIIENYGINGISISNISDLALLSHYPIEFLAEQSLNIANHYGADFLEKQGIKSIVLSLTLNAKECCKLAEKTKIQTERVIFGRPVLMQMKYCILMAANECPKGCNLCNPDDQYLLAGKNTYIAGIDRRRTETTLRSYKKMALPVLENDVDYLRIECTDESTEDINELAKWYLNGFYPVGTYIDKVGSK